MVSARIGVVGATGAVGRVTLEILEARGYVNVRAFASARSVGTVVGRSTIEEATSEALCSDEVDLWLFSVGTEASRRLVPTAAASGAVCIDKSAAFRLVEGVPLVVPEVNGDRAHDHSGIIANPNCCAIPLTMALGPLHDAVGLESIRVATYQSVSGAGLRSVEDLRAESADDHALGMDWAFDGVELDEETKLREETRKILEIPDLRVSATCVRVPVVVGHAEAVWVETAEPITPEQAEEVFARAPGLTIVDGVPRPAGAVGIDDVLVGRVRRDRAAENGLSLFIACDNLRKGAALNAIQIAEVALSAKAPA